MSIRISFLYQGSVSLYFYVIFTITYYTIYQREIVISTFYKSYFAKVLVLIVVESSN